MTDKWSKTFRKAYEPLIESYLENLYKLTSDLTYAHQKENLALLVGFYESGEILKGFGLAWMLNGKILMEALSSVKKGDAIGLRFVWLSFRFII